MAKQSGQVRIAGSLEDLTFYKQDGKDLVRKKTSLNKKRVMKDKAFARSRIRMVDFGVASKLSSLLYQQFPAKKKGKGIQQKMTGKVHSMLLEGKTEAEVIAAMNKKFGGSKT